MSRSRFYISFIVLCFAFTALPTQHAEAQVFERFSKRFLKKNRIKKLGKKLSRMGDNPLPDMAIIPDYEVIGFEPSWMIRNNSFEDHYFNLISTLVIGEYDIDPTTGQVRNRENFRVHLDNTIRDKETKQQMNIIQKADHYNPKINLLLHLTYYGDFGSEARQRLYTSSLLRDNQVHQTLKDSLSDYFHHLEIDYNLQSYRTGILIDFKLTNPRLVNEDFIDFIEYLRDELGEERLIYLRIPAKIKKNSFYNPLMILRLQESVNIFVIQGHGFENHSKEPVESVIFDKSKGYSIDGTLKEYLKVYEDQELFRERFIVELPYFGIKWKRMMNGQFQLDPSGHFITIDDFNREVKGKTGKLKYKKDNLVAALDEGDSLIYVVEDSLSLATKYAYLVDTLGMKGFGLNALGYYTNSENKRSEIWAAIADTYGEKREKLGWIIAMYITAFIPLGFFLSVKQSWEVRNALAKFGNYWTRFQGFFIFFILVFLVCAGALPRLILVIIGLIIMAAFLLYILVKKAIMKSKKYVNIIK